MRQLQRALIDELKCLYDAEKQLSRVLLKFVKAAQHTELKFTFESYQEEIEMQSTRLEQVFECFEEAPKLRKCRGMQGLIEEAEQHIKDGDGDAVLVCAFQKLKHYEIAAYGSLAAWAKSLGETGAADLLEEMLQEEKLEDDKLSDIAETAINLDESVERGDKGQRFDEQDFGARGRAQGHYSGKKPLPCAE